MPGVDGLETGVMDQRYGYIFGLLIVAAVHEARPRLLAFGFEHSEQHLTGNGLESRDYMSPRNFLCKLFRSRRGVGDDEFRVVCIHRKRAG